MTCTVVDNQKQFGECTEALSACIGQSLDTITVGHVATTFTPHWPHSKHKSRPQRATSRAKENGIVFQSMLVALWGLPATETLLIKRRQTTRAVKRRGGEGGWTEGGGRGERADDKTLACLNWCPRHKQTQFPHLNKPVLQSAKYELQNAEFHFVGAVLIRALVGRSSQPWPISVCFALMWPPSFEV